MAAPGAKRTKTKQKPNKICGGPPHMLPDRHKRNREQKNLLHFIKPLDIAGDVLVGDLIVVQIAGEVSVV